MAKMQPNTVNKLGVCVLFYLFVFTPVASIKDKARDGDFKA
jgi:hypothetical protein